MVKTSWWHSTALKSHDNAAVLSLDFVKNNYKVPNARTNKCTMYNATPADLTNMTKSGDAASTLTVVDDSAELRRAGFASWIDTGYMNGSVYKLDNTSGVGQAHAYCSGVTGGAGSHVYSVYIRGTGSLAIRTTDAAITTATFVLPTVFTRRSFPFTATGSQGVMITAQAGAVVYFILNQLEVGPIPTSNIIVEGAAASIEESGAASTLTTQIAIPTLDAAPGTNNNWNLNVAGNISTLTPNDIYGPDGVNKNAAKISTAAFTGEGVYFRSSVLPTPGKTYTFSVWVYATSGLTMALSMGETGGTAWTSTANTNFTLTANKWQRLAITRTAAASVTAVTTAFFITCPSSTSNIFWVARAQVDLGSSPSGMDTRTRQVPTALVNSSLVGGAVGVVGSGGRIPFGWNVQGPAGMNTEVQAITPINGMNKYKIRIWGTNSSGATNYPGITTLLHSSYMSPVTPNTLVTGSIECRYLGVPTHPIILNTQLYDSGLAYLANLPSGSVTATAQKIVSSGVSHTSTAYSALTLYVVALDTQIYDYTFEIYAPMITVGIGDTMAYPTTSNRLASSQNLSGASWQTLNTSTVTNAYGRAPDNTLTATRIVRTSAGQAGVLRQYASTPVVGPYVMSVWAKSNTGSNQAFAFRWYDNIVAGNTSTAQTATTSWQRFQYTITTTQTGSNFQFDLEINANGGDILFWGAQLEYGTVASEFVATVGTNIGSQTLVVTGVPAKTNTNLITSSEDFSSWGLITATVTANQIVAPDGKTSADLVTCTSIAANNGIVYKTPLLNIFGIYTASVYAKAGTSSGITLQPNHMIDSTPSGVTATFNLSTQVVGGGSTYGAVRFISSSITSVNNGWYRCSVTYQISGTAVTSGALWVFPYISGDAANTTAYLWGAQYERGLVATPYVSTGPLTNNISNPTYTDNKTQRRDFLTVPGLTYSRNSVSYAEAGAPLIANHSMYSQDLANALTWSGGGTATSVVSDATTAPDGTTTADKLVEDGTASNHFVRYPWSRGNGRPEGYMVSFYAKAAGRTKIGFGSNNVYATGLIDLSNGSIYASNGTVTVTDVGNSWWRISGIIIPGGGTGIYIGMVDNSTWASSYTGDGSSGVYLWGCQSEKESSTPSNYIRTDGINVETSMISNLCPNGDFAGTTGAGVFPNLFNITGAQSSSTTLSAAENIAGFTAQVVKQRRVGATGYEGFQLSPAITFQAGVYTISAYVRRANGVTPTDVGILFCGTAYSLVISATLAAQAADTWVRYSTQVTLANNAAGSTGLISSNPQGIGTGFDVALLQIDRSPVLNKYLPTTTTAAFEGGPSLVSFNAGVPRITDRGFLVEMASTNKLYSSTTLNSGQWSVAGTAGGHTITGSAGIAPDGTNTAWLFTAGTNMYNSVLRGSAPTIVNGTNYSFSVYIKPSACTCRYVGFRVANWATGAASDTYPAIDIATMRPLGTGATAVKWIIEPKAGGWWRVGITVTCNTTVADIVDIAMTDASGNTNVTTQAGQKLMLWGPQVEVADYCSSYIPTTGAAAVTRPADSTMISGNLTGNGTMLAEVDFGPKSLTLAAVNEYLVTMSDGTSANKLIMFKKSGTAFGAFRHNLNSVAANPGDTPFDDLAIGISKMGLSWSPGLVLGSDNGRGVSSATPVSNIPFTKINIGTAEDASGPVNAYIRKLQLIPYNITQTELNNRTKL